MDSSAYKEKVGKGSYDFLRTAEVFKKAMLIAEEKFEWTKKSF